MALTLPSAPVQNNRPTTGGLTLPKARTQQSFQSAQPTPAVDFKNSPSNINNPQSPYYQQPKPVNEGLGAPIGRLLQKIPSPNLGTRGKDVFKATETETKIVDFLSNMPSAILNSWGKSLETLSTPDGKKKLKEDAKRLPQTAQEVKDHLSKKEWGQAMQTAFDNSAVSVGMDVADFIPITWLGKAGLKGINASLRKTGQQIVKEGVEEAGFKTVKEVFEPVKVPEVPKPEVKPVDITKGLEGGGGKLQPLAEEARKQLRPAELDWIKQRGVDIDNLQLSKETATPQEILNKLTPEMKKDVLSKVDRETAQLSTSRPILIKGKDGLEIMDGSHALAGKLKENKPIEYFIEKSSLLEGAKVAEEARGIKLYSGSNSTKGSRYFSADPTYAQGYGKNITEVNIPKSEIFDIRNPEHKQIFDTIKSNLQTNNEIDPLTGLIKSQGDAKEIENALQKAGYNFKAIAMSENTGGIAGKGEISYFVKTPVSSPLEGAKVAPKVEPSITTQKVDTLKDAAQIKKAINKTSQEIHQLTNELQGKAEANKMRIEGLNMQNLAQLKNIVARSEKFQIGDVETIRASKTGQLMDKVLENIRENNPQFEDLYDDELLKLALSMPSKGETVFRKTPEIKQLEERAKTLQTYFKALENKYKSLTDKEKEVIFKDWQDAVIAQENLEKVIGVRKGFLPVGEEELKLSRLEARITQQLDEAPEEVKNLSTFNQMNKKDQIAQAVAYVSNHTDEALRILTGEKEPPEGILRNSVYVAMQNLAKGDVELARKLSSLTSTRFGQEISILTEIDPYSPVNIARDIFKIKEEVFKKRFGGREPGEVIKNLADKGKNDIKPPSKLEWGSLISEIRCK